MILTGFADMRRDHRGDQRRARLRLHHQALGARPAQAGDEAGGRALQADGRERAPGRATCARANLFLEAVMDELDTGALAVDAAGVDPARSNRPVRDYLGARGRPARQAARARCSATHGLAEVGEAAVALARRARAHLGGRRGAHRAARAPAPHHDAQPDRRQPARRFGRVILIREISHEPMQRRFDDLVGDIVACDGELRARGSRRRASSCASSVGEAQGSRRRFARDGRAGRAHLAHAHRDRELARRRRRARARGLPRRAAAAGPHARRDDALAAAATRCPRACRTLARRVEDYYESGENPKQRVL